MEGGEGGGRGEGERERERERERGTFLFFSFQPLLSLAESLIVQLKSRMEGWDDRCSRIGDIFMHMVSP